MATTPSATIDLSAGLVPAQSNSSGIDLSAGLVPASEQQQTQPGFLESAWSGLKKAGSDVYGAVTSIAPPTQTNAAASLPGKALGMAEDVANGINNLTGITTVTDSLKNAAGMFDAYEKARSSGGSIVQALHAANEQSARQDAITPMIKERVAAFQKNPSAESVRALGDVVATAAAIYGTHKLVGAPAPAVPAETAEAAAPEEAAASKPNIVTKLVKGERVAQAPAKQALTTAAADAATDSGVSAEAGTGGTRTFLDKTIAQTAANEKGLYSTLNDAAGTDMKSLYERAEEIQDALDDPTQVSNKTALQSELKTTQEAIQTGEANVHEALGEDAHSVLQQAKDATQQRFALQEVKKSLFNNESVVQGDVAHGSPESIDVDSAIRAVQKLNKPSRFAPEGSPSRLVQALGPDGANKLLSNLYAAQRAGQSAVGIRKVAAWVAGGASAGTAIKRLLF